MYCHDITLCAGKSDSLAGTNNMLYQVESCLKVKISQSVMSGTLPQEQRHNFIR